MTTERERNKLVPFAAALRQPDPARLAAFAETARRLQSERTVAEDVVTNALRDTPRSSWPTLAEREDFRTSGALARLGKEVEKRLETDPREALAIAELATAIADVLQPDSYPGVIVAQIRAHAWKDRCRALSYIGRYEDALRALDRADAELEAFGTLGHDRAIINFCRATLLQHLRRFDEAHELLSECRSVFREHGDTQLHMKCTLAAGILLARRADYRAAKETLTPLLSSSSMIALEARMALGWCDIHLGSAADAITHFDEAARGYQQHGRELETVRAAYGRGSALLHLQRFTDAVTTLRSTRRTFLDRGLIEEGGLSGLGIVEAQLVLGETAAARTLAATLVHEFTAANLNRRAVAALAYLNDAIAASSATPEVVRDVHAYITALRTDPTRDFARVN